MVPAMLFGGQNQSSSLTNITTKHSFYHVEQSSSKHADHPKMCVFMDYRLNHFGPCPGPEEKAHKTYSLFASEQSRA